MSARADILAGKFKTSPAAMAALRAAGGSGPAAELFSSFVGYANATWSYAAQPGGLTAKNVLDGNVGNHGQSTFNLACYFSTHYFLQTGGRYYDPCLMAVYTSPEGPIAHRTKTIMGCTGLRKAGTGRSLVLLHLLPGRSVPGFGSVWEILLLSECKAVLKPNEFTAVKNDIDVKSSKLL